MRTACTGIHGNIGSTLVERWAIPLDVDVTDEKAVRRVLKKASPDIVIHTASKSKPNWCEEHTAKALDVNFRGSWNLAHACLDAKIPMVALSTDHVFTGKFALTKIGFVNGGPYSEDYKRLFPVNYYGMTKFAMEALMHSFDNVKVVRTSNCFWRNDPRVVWYIDQLYVKDKVPVPTFQHRSFMHKQHFAESLEKYCEMFDKMPKIIHISGSKTVSWYEFAISFADAIGVPKSLSKKFTKQRFEKGKFVAERPKKAGLKTDLSAKLGLPTYDYLDGMELLK